jgi:hypothetical protein
MSAVIDSLARHLQDRVNAAEPKIVSLSDLAQDLQERLEAAERERDAAYALLRIFGREHTHAEIAPREAFGRAAEMTRCRT